MVIKYNRNGLKPATPEISPLNNHLKDTIKESKNYANLVIYLLIFSSVMFIFLVIRGLFI